MQSFGVLVLFNKFIQNIKSIIMAPFNKTVPQDIDIQVQAADKARFDFKDPIALFKQLKWTNIILITILHVYFVIEAKLVFLYPDLFLSNFIFSLITVSGVSGGAHRLWTHHAYKAKTPMKVLMMIGHVSTGNSPIFHWVRDHRLHHKYTDTDADPYNAKRGFFFSHVGWLMIKKHPDLIKKGKQIDMSDILEDSVIQFHHKYYVPLVLFFAFILPSIIPPLLWGQDWYPSIVVACILRYVIVLNITWSINSVAHKFGTKPYDIKTTATDNKSASLATFGESWHNFHHAFPWAYKLGWYGSPLDDVPGFIIDQFAKIGWAYDLKFPSMELIEKAAKRIGDGTNPWAEYINTPEPAKRKNGIDLNNNIVKSN